MQRLYVGNLSYTSTEGEIRALFEQHGTVNRVDLINDRETGRPRGFGFVEMDSVGASAAIDALHGKDHDGRTLRVNEARRRGE